MAVLAGAADTCALVRLAGDNASFMSGDLVTLGVAAGHRDLPSATAVVFTVGVFLAGAILGGVVSHLARQHAAPVTFLAAAILLVPLLVPGITVAALAFAMGTLNAAISRTGRISVGLTFSTGNLVRFGQGLGRALCGQPDGGVWAWQLLPPAGLATGALATVLVQARWGEAVFWPVPALAFGLAIWCTLLPPRR